MVDRDYIASRYHDHGIPAEQIATEQQVTVRSVYRWMAQAGRPANQTRRSTGDRRRRVAVPIDPAEIEAGRTYRIVGRGREAFKAVTRISDEGWRFYSPDTAKFHCFRNSQVLATR